MSNSAVGWLVVLGISCMWFAAVGGVAWLQRRGIWKSGRDKRGENRHSIWWGHGRGGGGCSGGGAGCGGGCGGGG